MPRVTRPVIEEDKLGDNPFTAVELFQIPTRRYETSSFDKKGDVFLPAVRVSEYQDYTKLYAEPAFRLRTNKLSLRAKEMFLWIMYTIKAGQETIWINRERYMKEMGISSNTTVLTTIKDLIKLNYLAKTAEGKDMYFINPKYFFQGDRLKKYHKNTFVKYDVKEPENREDEEAVARMSGHVTEG